MAGSDTLTVNIAEVVQPLIAATVALLPQEAPALNLVTRINTGRGHDRVLIPRVNSTSTVQNPTEGDELVTSSQFDLTSTTIQPTHRALMVRVHERATYFSRDDVIAMVSEELAQSQAQDIDTDITAEFTNFSTSNDVGASNTDLTLAVLRNARQLLMSVTRANGGPAPMPIYFVMHPVVEENLYTNLGLQGVVSSTNPWIPTGMSEEVIQNYYIDRLLGIPMFRDGYMTQNGSGDFLCAMFAKKSIHLIMSKDWDMRTFEVPNWIGPIIRCVADYNTGIGAYTQHGAQITADGV